MSDALPDPRYTRFLPWIVAMALFMQTLDGTILNTALPAMARSLNESPLNMQSAVIGYLLTVAMLIPASGWLADRFGSRRVFIVAIVLFALGSLACAMSTTLNGLVIARIAQGVGGALMMPVGRLTVLRSFPRSELVRVLSFVTIPGLLGPLLGPTLGGWLVEFASWHWIFLINLPVGLVGCIAASRFMPDIKSPEKTPFDGVGFLLFATAMALISIAFEGLGELHFSHARVVLLIAGGLSCLAAYWLHSNRHAAPLFSGKLFETHSFAVGITGNLFARIGSGAMPFLTPLLLQVALGFSPMEAGMSMIPLALASIGSKAIATPLIKRFGFRHVLICNTLLLGTMIAGFSLLDGNTPRLALYAYLATYGAINSLQFTAMNALTLIDLDNKTAASGNSLLSVVMQLSISLGVASASALLGGFIDLKQLPDQALILEAFHKTYLCVGLMAMFAAAIFFQLRRDERPEEAPEPEKIREDDDL
ncbi:multidrug transporter subunit MdtD [Propionivibrio limicola]|uniref:multidrug transporter subunit MdtD n=1 Tax=Propionivibrio limicola TaxID=167645 RepID=UPI0012919D5D|nr:multidrug transporter subunit MdtD [Propionivibrio limicola]